MTRAIIAFCCLIVGCQKRDNEVTPLAAPTQAISQPRDDTSKRRVEELEGILKQKEDESAELRRQLAITQKDLQALTSLAKTAKPSEPPATFSSGDTTKIAADKFGNGRYVASSLRQWEKLIEANKIGDTEGILKMESDRLLYRWKPGTRIRVLKRVADSPEVYEIRCLDRNGSEDKRVDTTGMLGYTVVGHLEPK